jgi:four helix bundle protein
MGYHGGQLIGERSLSMPLITRFEELDAWKEARGLTHRVYQTCSAGSLAKDYGLRDQVCRAAVSTMANVAEGFDCESRAERARFMGIARRSAVEVQSLLYVALDAGHISADSFKSLYAQAAKVKALVGGLKHSATKPPRPLTPAT